MKNLANPLTIKVVGSIVGKIWMPSTYAAMEFNINVTTERERHTDGLSIREAIERYLSFSTGDFQSAAIATGYLILEAWNGKGNRKLTRYIDLKNCPCVADLMADQKEMDAFESVQWQEN